MYYNLECREYVFIVTKAIWIDPYSEEFCDDVYFVAFWEYIARETKGKKSMFEGFILENTVYIDWWRELWISYDWVLFMCMH